jgi:hypothetical protein
MSDINVASPTAAPARIRYFVTSPTAHLSIRSDGHRIRGGPFHAKQMGTSHTACGQPTASWKKLWAVPFNGAVAPLCRACVAALTEPQ